MDEATEQRLKRGRDRLLRELRGIQADAELSDIQMIALLSFAAGAAVAGVDPSVLSPARAIDLVRRNVEAGLEAGLATLAQVRRN